MKLPPPFAKNTYLALATCEARRRLSCLAGSNPSPCVSDIGEERHDLWTGGRSVPAPVDGGWMGDTIPAFDSVEHYHDRATYR